MQLRTVIHQIRCHNKAGGSAKERESQRQFHLRGLYKVVPNPSFFNHCRSASHPHPSHTHTHTHTHTHNKLRPRLLLK